MVPTSRSWQMVLMVGAEEPGSPRTKLEQLLLPFENAAAPDEKTYIVGVTDPSDLLSWPLPESQQGSSVVLINAYHAAVQSGIWVPVLGTLGNPYSAHTDYGADGQVLRWLLHGNRIERGLPATTRRGY